ncbi:diacylglycerol/lipid kinase family protein [Rothia halotolerans]|uniref:diacylglycerol/lipid kinase family protein n=1 Tax=Rothia halotolerans TaxID=405770 RepID=UPI00101CB02F|nr:diacylglycerol kinase family protein [Rothia halotolerans]
MNQKHSGEQRPPRSVPHGEDAPSARGDGGARFRRIVLIYNPDPGKVPLHAARLLADRLERTLPGVPLEHRWTERAGHGRQIARAEAEGAAPSGPPILLVSVSGDGGYNDVVSGVMDVPAAHVVCAVLAAGNANDHRRSTRTMPLADAILRGRVREADLLRLTVRPSHEAVEHDGPEPVTHVAHSYIGFGLTAAMAGGIEDAGKGSFRELLGVVKTAPALRPFEIRRADGERALYDSLVFANVGKMAKYGRISHDAEPDDGRFEILAVPHASRWRMLGTTLQAVTIGLFPQATLPRYAFETFEELPLQVDGEILRVPARSRLLVESAHRAIRALG